MIHTLIKPLAYFLSVAGRERRLCILTYHRALPEPDDLRPSEPDAAQFASQLESLRKVFNIVRLDEAVRLMAQDALPPRALSITFDDGYRDNHDIALPILRRQGVPATFFIATGYLGGGAMFNDIVMEAIRQTRRDELRADELLSEPLSLRSLDAKRAAIRTLLPVVKKIPPGERNACVQRLCDALGVEPIRDLMMDASQVKALFDAGMEIGAHTVRHPILNSLPEEEAFTEIASSKRTLEALVGKPIVGFAYPNGRPGVDYESAIHPAQVQRAGFEYAVSTRWATATKSANRFELARVATYGSTPQEHALRAVLAYRHV